MSCPSMMNYQKPVPKDKGIKRHELNNLLDDAIKWITYSGMILAHIHEKIVLFYKEEIEKLEGKEYNDFIMDKIESDPGFQKYLEIMDVVFAEKYQACTDKYKDMTLDDKLQFIKYNIQGFLKVEVEDDVRPEGYTS